MRMFVVALFVFLLAATTVNRLPAQTCATVSISFSQPVVAGKLVTATVEPGAGLANSKLTVTESLSSKDLVASFPLPVTATGALGGGVFSFTPPDATNTSTSYEYTVVATPETYTLKCPQQTISGSVIVLPPPLEALSGSYAFLVKGVSSSALAGAPAEVAIGSIVSDGKGNITSGEIDLNSASATYQRLPVTGKYTLNTQGVGTLTLKTDEGTRKFLLTLGTEADGKRFSMLEDDTTGNYGNGSLMPQTLPASVAGSWIVDLTGELACSERCATPAGIENLIFATGSLAFSAAGDVTAQVNSTAQLQDTLNTSTTGMIPGGTFDNLGRLNFTLSTRKIRPEQPQNFVGYFVSATQLLIMTVDPHSSDALLSGAAR